MAIGELPPSGSEVSHQVATQPLSQLHFAGPIPYGSNVRAEILPVCRRLFLTHYMPIFLLIPPRNSAKWARAVNHRAYVRP